MAKRKFDEIGGVVEPPPYPPVKLEFRLEERNPYDDEVITESKSSSASLFSNIMTNGVHEENKPDPVFSTEWNEEFQRYYEQPTQTAQQRLDRASKLSTLYNKFVNRAKELGKTIIEEYSLAANHKTVDRFGDRGMAGGEKFLRDGIFFKLATDHVGIYGGDSFSMKAADHEIKSLNALLACDIPKLHLPMMVVLDYYGFRLVAEAALPVNRKTIVYGSDDGCKTLHDDDDEMRFLVKTAARRLGLKAHNVKALQYEPVRPRWLQGPAASHPLTTQNPQVNRSYHYRKKNIPRFSSWKGHRFFGGERNGPNPMDRPPHSSDMSSANPFGPPRKKLRISREGDAAVIVVTPTVTMQSSAMFDESREVLVSSDSNLETTYDINMEDGKVTGVITGDPYNEDNGEETPTIDNTDNGVVLDDTSNLLANALTSDNDVGGYSDVNPIEGETSNSLPSTQPLEDSTAIVMNNTNILHNNTNTTSLAVLSSTDFDFPSHAPRSPMPMPHTPSGLYEESWTLHFPADVEGHKGTDERLYILDVQRLFPAEDEFLQTFGVKIHCDLKQQPELVCINRSKFDEEIGAMLGEHVDWIEKQVPEETMMIYSAYDTGSDNSEHVNIIASFVTDTKTVGNAIITTGSKRESLYYLFRPELIRQSAVPISSDVYSKFGQDNHEEHEREAKQLRRKLLDEVIPNFVDWLCNNSERVISALHLPALMHKWGINLRYLGRIYSLLPAHHRMKDNLLGYQMIARVIKSQLRTKLRAQNFTSPIRDREKCVVNFFNMVLGEGIRSDQYWRFSIPLQLLLKYGPFGFDLKDIDTASLKTKVSKLTLFHLLQEFTGVKIRPEVSKLFKSEQHYPQDARLIRDSSSSQITAAEVSSVPVESVRRSREAPLTIADIDSIRVQLKTVKDIRGGWQQMWDNIATCCQTESSPTDVGPDEDPEVALLHGALLTHPDESHDTCQVRDEQHAGQQSLADQRTAAILNPALSPRDVGIARVLNLARLRKRQLQLVHESFGEHTPQSAACAFLLVDLFSAHHCHDQARVYARLGIEALLNTDFVPVEIILSGLFVLGVASERAAQLSVASALYCGLLNITEELFDSGVTGATPFEMELHERLERIYSAQLEDTQYAGCQSDASVPDSKELDCDSHALQREISVQLQRHQSKLTSLRSIFRKKLDTQKLVTKCLLFKKTCGLTYSFKQLLHEFDSHVVEFFFGATPVQ